VDWRIWEPLVAAVASAARNEGPLFWLTPGWSRVTVAKVVRAASGATRGCGVAAARNRLRPVWDWRA